MRFHGPLPSKSSTTAPSQAQVTLRSQFYYYSFQWQHRGEQWAHPQATYYDGVTGTVEPEHLRNGKADREMFNAGRHCSSCMPSLDHGDQDLSLFAQEL